MNIRRLQTHRLLFHVVLFGQLTALLLTGIVAARPLAEKHDRKAVHSVSDETKKIAAGVGDTTPTDNTATSDPVSSSTHLNWILAPALVPDQVRSIKFNTPVLDFDSIEEPREVALQVTVCSSLGDISPVLPYRFSLVGLRPSGTS